jgi:hypothetical protein
VEQQGKSLFMFMLLDMPRGRHSYVEAFVKVTYQNTLPEEDCTMPSSLEPR